MSELRWIGRLYSGAQNAVEQVGSDRAVSERRNRAARLGQISIGLRVEQRTGTARRGYPLCKAFGWHSLDVEAHIGETIAAELGRQSPVCSRMVRLQVKARHHSRHGVDLAAELRHE